MSARREHGREVYELLVNRLKGADRRAANEGREVRENGVYLREDRELVELELLVEEYDTVAWHPLRDLSKPALPFPFTARDLAAFCFPGYGSPLIELYEDSEGIDPEKLANLGRNGSLAAQVVVETHALLIELNERFYPDVEHEPKGADVEAAPERSSRIGEQERAARKAAREEGVAKDAAIENAALAWLLAESASENSATSERAEEPVSPLINYEHLRLLAGPAPIPTNLMCVALNGVGGKKADRWKKTLADAPNWALEARVERGKPPRPSTWDPIKLAAAIRQRYGIEPLALMPIFRRRELADWLPAWTEELKEISHLKP